MKAITQVTLFLLIVFLLSAAIFKERAKLKKMASSDDRSKWIVLAGVIIFIALMNSLVFSTLAIIALDSLKLTRVIGDNGMILAIIILPLIPSWIVSEMILRNRKWAFFTVIVTIITVLFLVLTCFYCIGGY